MMKKVVQNILLLLISTGIVLVIGEGVIRLTNIAYEPQYDNRVQITRPAANPIIRYELIPNYDGQALGGLVKVNAFGFRGSDVSLNKPAGITRVAVLGDSWAFGWGVNQNEVVTSVLEEELNKSQKAKQFEVLNFSLFGYNLQQEEAVLNEKVLSFKPDIVIFAFNVNDLEGIQLLGDRAISQRKEMTFKESLFKTFREFEGFGNQHSHLFRLMDNAFRGMAILLHFDKPGKKLHYKQFYEDGTKEFSFLKSALHRIGALADQHGFRVCVVYFPWMNELTADNPYTETFEKVQAVAETEGFLTFNLFPYYEGWDVGKLRISHIDGHPTALGHKIAADALVKFLADHFSDHARL